MTLLQDEDLRFRRLSRKIGIFLSIAALGIVITLISIGVQQKLITPKSQVFFVTDSGREIVQGMAVKLSGFRIGKVKRLELTEQAAVKVTLEIQSEYMKWVRQDSKARLLKEGVIGDTVIEVAPGSEKSPQIVDSNQIAFEREVGMAQLVDQLYDDVRPLIADVRSVVQRTDGLLKRADSLLASLPSSQQHLDAVLSSAQRNLQNLEKTTATELPATVRRGREVIDSSKKVVDSLSRTWPISNNIDQPKAGVLPLDSYGNATPPPRAPQK